MQINEQLQNIISDKQYNITISALSSECKLFIEEDRCNGVRVELIKI